FVLDALGVRWICDTGMQAYDTLESQGLDIWNPSQDSDRWRVFRLNHDSHSIITVNGRPPRVEGRGTLLHSGGDDDALPHTALDLTTLYAGDLSSARRSVAMVDDAAVIVDDRWRAGERDVVVRWAMMTC